MVAMSRSNDFLFRKAHMSLIYNDKVSKNKRTYGFKDLSVYKNTFNAALVVVFGVLSASFAHVAMAQKASVTFGQTSPSASAPMTLEQATSQSLQATLMDPNATKDRDLRSRAMQEAAQSFGARSGLMRRTYEINEAISIAAPNLDAIWNFQPFMLTDAQPDEVSGLMRQRLIVPAVIIEAKSIFKQDSAGLIHLIDATYKIESQPRFSSVTPSWRDYLFRDLGESTVTSPHISLLPRTQEEKSNWSMWIAQGWEAGISQANGYLDYDLNRLKRDRDGMVLYHEMVAKKMVSLPHVATSNEGVSGDDTTMNINESMLRITVMPAFQRDSKNWLALPH